MTNATRIPHACIEHSAAESRRKGKAGPRTSAKRPLERPGAACETLAPIARRKIAFPALVAHRGFCLHRVSDKAETALFEQAYLASKVRSHPQTTTAEPFGASTH